MLLLTVSAFSYADYEKLNCPSIDENYLFHWERYKANVKEAGEEHRDYSLLFSYLMPESKEITETYFFNQCLPSLNDFENGENAGSIEQLKIWISCLKDYFRSAPPDLIEELELCPVIGIPGYDGSDEEGAVFDYMYWDKENEALSDYIARINYLAFEDLNRNELRRLLIKIQNYVVSEKERLRTDNEYNPDLLSYISPLANALEVLQEEQVNCSAISTHLALGYRLEENSWAQLPASIHEILPLLLAYCKADD